MSQAWHTASIPNMKGGWPSLAKLLGDEPQSKAQTPEQMLAAMQAWAAVTKH
jgi:hypothetical protein